MSFWGSFRSFTSNVDRGFHHALKEANKEVHAVTRTVEQTVHHVEAKATETIHSVEKAAKSFGHAIDVRVGEATHEVKKVVQHVGHYVDHKVNDAVHVATKTVKSLDHDIKKVEHTVEKSAKKVQNVVRNGVKEVEHTAENVVKDVKKDAQKVVKSITHSGYTYKAEQVAKTAYNFASGAGSALVNNAAFGLPDKVLHQPANANTTAYQVGRVAGDAISTVVGAVETLEGGGIALAGGTAAVVTSPTGIGAVAGGAVAVGGVAVAAHGVTQVTNGLENFGADISKLHEHLQMASTKGSGGSRAQETAGAEESSQVRNAHLAGSTHPVTGVPFDKDGFPIFNSKYDHQLPEHMHTAKDPDQFKNANQGLQQHVQDHPESASHFSDQQLAQISKGKQPKGLTWHHHQEPGKLQLVDSETHGKTGHTGGRNIWGGGSKNR